ncbi:N-6 DNA methylase [Conexibacter stalactiti]|uniref:site-specific DNA-methyltransferase (adenine-specific) n=1 Tax=Conexibacter stalactiti TaxID=1940611 RepID=A0ABU4HLV4_9ACTN|nr:N-6 DNA methylase [Conexibacter stalactiti]MDW5593014.1 N-6 DNA methylase [Conexibacter stalactiti]MEC5033655.1 N-6 DNA methylase [Conexibacter stalactiti]
MSRRLHLTTLLGFSGERHSAEHALAFLFLRLLGTSLPGTSSSSTAWDGLADVPGDCLGSVLDETCRGCEKLWPALTGFFDGVEFTRCSASSLQRSVERVERVVASYPSATCLAEAYQTTRSLTTAQWQGAFFTPYSLARVLAQVQEPSPTDWVLDPACGGGVMLVAALDVARELHGTTAALALTLIGVELDPRTAAIARASLVLAGAHPDQFWIGCGNALAQPLVGFDRRRGRLQPLQCTLSLANPPFGRAASVGARFEGGKPLVVPDRVLYRLIPRRREESR